MDFGRIPLSEAQDAVLAHTLRVGPRQVFKKGRVLSAADLRALADAGHESVVAARLAAHDVAEDAAATRVAASVAGDHVRSDAAATGRVNLVAAADGLVVVDAARVDAVNAVDEGVTLATLPPFAKVARGMIVATAKIIPFGVPADVAARAVAAAGDGAISVRPFAPVRAGLVLTQLPATKPALVERAAASLRARVEGLGGTVVDEVRCDHRVDAVAVAVDALCERGCTLILLLGASAIIDRADVIPAGVVAAGGDILHFGMPVDPGNLLLLARRGAVDIIGAPGCARSLAPSGFDRVLERLCAGLPVDARVIQGMGVGGLLKEIRSRPQPRHTATRALPAARVAAVVLAAGASRRMGTQNKLLATVDDAPMVAHVVDALAASGVARTVVVTGHDAERVRAALSERDVTYVHNPDFARGMATSLRAGVNAAAADDIDAVLVCLGDMPWVHPAHIDALIAAFDPDDGAGICVPTYEGRRGNPVLWAARYLPEMRAIDGDRGARGLLETHAADVRFVAVSDAGVLVDIDTEAALNAALAEPLTEA